MQAKNSLYLLAAALLATNLLALSACNSASDDPVSIDSTKSTAGYAIIEPISYYFKDRETGVLDLETSESRIWYSYLPADADVASKPLFVLINGGPGSPTSTQLFSMNTASYTLDREHISPPDAGYAKNPYSWTRMGNLLYIDAPVTGFSYNVSPTADTQAGRIGEFFLKGNFNPFIDAAQIARLVLRFLDSHPDIRANEVIMVGESYAGVRVTTLLNLLLFHDQYANGEALYQDESLVAEIRRHFHALYGPTATLTPGLVARQFSRQILIQPELSGIYQDEISGDMYQAPNSVIDQVATESGHAGEYRRTCAAEDLPPLVPNTPMNCAILYYLPKFGRDRYNYTKRTTWTDELEAYAIERLWDVEILSRVLDYDVTRIKALSPEARHQAYRLIDPDILGTDLMGYGSLVDPSLNPASLPGMARGERLNSEGPQPDGCYAGIPGESNTLLSRFGALQPWDCYLMGMNMTVYAAFTLFSRESLLYDINPDESVRYGRMFLENLPLVKTFLTDAEYDLVIYSPAIPKALERYRDLVRKIDVVSGKDTLDQRLGEFRVHYVSQAATETATPGTLSLYYPYYATSGHSVSSAQPDKLRADIMNWLSCSAASCP
ncbi:MAG: hypothetical protein WBJ41_17815 [Chromatiaceae bacterium]